MSDDVEHNRRRLLILDDVIDKLFSSPHKTKPLDVLEKKLEQMETLVANLSDRDSWSRGRDLFSTWKSRLLRWWERFAEERSCPTSTVVAESAAAGKVPAATVLDKSSSSGHSSAPSSSSLHSHNQPPNVDNTFPENIFKAEWPKLYSTMKQSFDNLSEVRSRDDCTRIHALYDNVDICFNTLVTKRLIGDHQIHNTVIMMATNKLPKSMQHSFRLQNKNSLKTLLTYLSDYKSKKIRKSEEKDEDQQKYNRSLTKVLVKSDDKLKKAIPTKTKTMPLIIPKPPPPPPLTHTVSSSDLALAVIPPLTCSESKNPSLSQTLLIKKDPKQKDQNELEDGELPESDSSLTSTASAVHQPTQSIAVTSNEKQTTTTSNNVEDLNIICCQIDSHFAEVPIIHSETDVTALKMLLRAVINATHLIKEYNGQKRALLDRRIFRLAECLMSNDWFWGVGPSKQTSSFMNLFLRKKILEANIASGRMIVQDNGKLAISRQQQKELNTKVCQTETEDKLDISEGVLTPSESSTDSSTDPETALDILALNSFLANCRREVSDSNEESKHSL